MIDAAEPAVVRALGDGATWRRAARAVGGRLDGPAVALQTGDTLVFAGSVPLRAPRRFTVRIGDDGLPELRGDGRGAASISVHTSRTGAGILTRLDYRTDGSAISTAVRRTKVLRWAEMLLGIATLVAREPLVVVAGAVLGANDRGEPAVLAALKRGEPPAGGWELPGGKVAAEESEPTALIRELHEELRIGARIGDRLGPDVDLGDGALLRAYRADTDDEPTAIEHAELRWLTAAELDDVDWLPADRTLLPALRAALRRGRIQLPRIVRGSSEPIVRRSSEARTRRPGDEGVGTP